MAVDQNFWNNEIKRIIKNAVREDVGDGDYSSLACIPDKAKGKAKLLVKEAGVLAGVDFAQHVFAYIDETLEIERVKTDGDKIKEGDVVFYVSGSSQSILKAERLVLNAMQRMSAIATKTNEFVDQLKGYNTRILDTRKTTPGIRVLEKWAVQIGGGTNHRFGLFDMIMLKDNHIDFAGGISAAIQKTKAYLTAHDLDLNIVVEARNLEEVKEILEAGKVYRILIDNFSYQDTRRAVELIDGKCQTESSGDITLATAAQYAACGVDFISSGSLTHSVYNLNLSLKAV